MIAGTPIGGDAAVIEAGLDLAIASNATFSLSYSGQIASDVQDHGFKAERGIKASIGCELGLCRSHTIA